MISLPPGGEETVWKTWHFVAIRTSDGEDKCDIKTLPDSSYKNCVCVVYMSYSEDQPGHFMCTVRMFIEVRIFFLFFPASEGCWRVWVQRSRFMVF